MQFEEMGERHGKTLMLLPGTACNYQINFGAVLETLGQKYHLICVNYDGFDGRDQIFPDMLTVTEKIERYIKDKHQGRIDGAIGSSLGSSFVGQLIYAGKDSYGPWNIRESGPGSERDCCGLAAIQTCGPSVNWDYKG